MEHKRFHIITLLAALLIMIGASLVPHHHHSDSACVGSSACPTAHHHSHDDACGAEDSSLPCCHGGDYIAKPTAASHIFADSHTSLPAVCAILTAYCLRPLQSSTCLQFEGYTEELPPCALPDLHSLKSPPSFVCA